MLESDLVITSADNSRIQVEGVVLVELVNRGKSALEMVYVCRGSKGCLLSLKAFIALGVVPEKFPEGQVRETSDRMECKDSDKEEVKDIPGKDNVKKGSQLYGQLRGVQGGADKEVCYVGESGRTLFSVQPWTGSF